MTPADIPIPPGLTGLSTAEATAAFATHGPNHWVPPDPWRPLRELLRTLLDPMAIMLAIAAALYFAIGETTDALVLALALVPVLGVDVLLEARSHAALNKLAAAAAPRAYAVRDGRLTDVALETVVPGDLLALIEGHVTAADGEVVSAANLALDESSLTGEAEPQPKHAGGEGAVSRFYAGSPVLAGHGFGRVTATGSRTAYGHLAAMVTGTAPAPSPLQTHATRLASRLGVVAILAAAALAGVGVLHGTPWRDALLGAVSLAMAAIPEEFPLVLTLFLSAGAWRLASRGMLVRRLASVETLGATTVICTDKTGTLTHGSFEAVAHVVLQDGATPADLLEMALLACERHPADAMEQALVRYGAKLGVAHDAVIAPLTLIRDYDFDALGKHMSHVWQRRTGAFVVAAKGALEGILEHAAATQAERDRAVAANAAMADRGLRVLAVAGRARERAGAGRDDDEQALTVYGLVGFEDPLRPEVPAAVAECQRAGITVKLITGDHALTAHAVAEAAGIVHDDALIVTGDELAGLDDAARRARVAGSAIFARISPEQKFLIVDTLKQAGAVVAMTGDGVNDAPALRRADIGIAMGRRGTDVARATADLVLLDDDFASIAATVREGRHLFANIQRAFLYLAAFHVPIVGLAALAPLTSTPLLLLPIHLVWLELIVHPVSALVFQAEPVTTAVMDRPPRDPAASILPAHALWRSLATGGLLTAVTWLVYAWQRVALGEPAARGAALVALLAGYQVLVFAERRAVPGSGLPRVPVSSLFWVVWLASALSLAAVLAVPRLAGVFHLVQPPLVPLLTAAALGIAAVAWRLVPVRGGR